MEAKMEKIDVNVVKFEVKVEAAKFSEALTKAYKKNVKKFNVPGFRKGKVPMNVVKQYYGLGVLLEDAVNFAIEESYSEVLKENNIIPVDYPKVDVVQVEEGKDFIYTAEVTVYPEVELGEYKGLSVEKKTYEVTEEEVSKKLKEMQEKNARVETKEEGTVENGNIAVIDFKVDNCYVSIFNSSFFFSFNSSILFLHFFKLLRNFFFSYFISFLFY